MTTNDNKNSERLSTFAGHRRSLINLLTMACIGIVIITATQIFILQNALSDSASVSLTDIFIYYFTNTTTLAAVILTALICFALVYFSDAVPIKYWRSLQRKLIDFHNGFQSCFEECESTKEKNKFLSDTVNQQKALIDRLSKSVEIISESPEHRTQEFNQFCRTAVSQFKDELQQSLQDHQTLANKLTEYIDQNRLQQEKIEELEQELSSSNKLLSDYMKKQGYIDDDKKKAFATLRQEKRKLKSELKQWEKAVKDTGVLDVVAVKLGHDIQLRLTNEITAKRTVSASPTSLKTSAT